MTVVNTLKTHPTGEVLYAIADAARISNDNSGAKLLSNLLHNYISDEKLKHLLEDEKISIKFSPLEDSARITINDSTLSKKEQKIILENILKAIKEIIKQ